MAAKLYNLFMDSFYFPSISVVIPTYNRKDRLIECVKSVLIAADNYAGYVQVVISDDASTDGTAETVRTQLQSFRVRYVQNEKRRMTAYCRNIGAMRWSKDTAKNDIDWFLFLDNDNVVEPDIFKNFAKFIQFNLDDNLGFVVGLTYNIPEHRIWTLGGHMNWWTGRYVEDYESLLGEAKEMEDIDKMNLPESFPTYANILNCVFIKGSAFRETGGYNTSYDICFEDIDYSLRLIRSGYNGVVCTTTRTKHFHLDERTGINPVLRKHGIYEPEIAYCIARNKPWMMKYFSPWYVRPLHFLTFAWIPGLYYTLLAVKYKRFDCAKAILKGMLKGIFIPPPICRFN